MIPQNEYYSDVQHDFSAVYKKSTGPFNMESYHYHNVYEAYYLINGERRFFYKDRVYHVIPGNIIMVKAYELHSMSDWDIPGNSRILIDFKSDFLACFSNCGYDLLNCYNKDIVVIESNPKHQQAAYEKFSNIVNEYNSNEPGRELCLRALLADLLIYISRLQDIYHDKKEPSESKQVIISQIMRFINENYEKKLSLQDIADHIGYNRNYLCTFFKKNSNLTITEYINVIRIKHSQEYLKQTDMSVTDISSLCGFECLSHYGRVFKSIIGCSPLQYRKKTSQSQHS